MTEQSPHNDFQPQTGGPAADDLERFLADRPDLVDAFRLKVKPTTIGNNSQNSGDSGEASGQQAQQGAASGEEAPTQAYETFADDGTTTVINTNIPEGSWFARRRIKFGRWLRARRRTMDPDKRGDLDDLVATLKKNQENRDKRIFPPRISESAIDGTYAAALGAGFRAASVIPRPEWRAAAEAAVLIVDSLISISSGAATAREIWKKNYGDSTILKGGGNFLRQAGNIFVISAPTAALNVYALANGHDGMDATGMGLEALGAVSFGNAGYRTVQRGRTRYNRFLQGHDDTKQEKQRRKRYKRENGIGLRARLRRRFR